MQTFNILDHTGHTTKAFTAEQRLDAAQLFDKLTKGDKMLAYANDGNGVQRTLREFDPNAAEITFSRQLQGG